MGIPPKKDPRFAGMRSAGLLLAIPTLLIVSPLVGFFVGSFCDRWLRTKPWLSLVGLILGFITAGRETWLIYRRAMMEDERDRRG